MRPQPPPPFIDPHDARALAEEALLKARKMKPGPERSAALKQAGQLQVAAELKQATSASKR
jgi:hypothetical protein